MTIKGTEYTFKDFTTLRMRTLATSCNAALLRHLDQCDALLAPLVVKPEDANDDERLAAIDAVIDTLPEKILDLERKVDAAFKTFCELALVEPFTGSYFDLTSEEAAQMQEDFYKGLQTTKKL